MSRPLSRWLVALALAAPSVLGVSTARAAPKATADDLPDGDADLPEGDEDPAPVKPSKPAPAKPAPEKPVPAKPAPEKAPPQKPAPEKPKPTPVEPEPDRGGPITDGGGDDDLPPPPDEADPGAPAKPARAGPVDDAANPPAEGGGRAAVPGGETDEFGDDLTPREKPAPSKAAGKSGRVTTPRESAIRSADSEAQNPLSNPLVLVLAGAAGVGGLGAVLVVGLVVAGGVAVLVVAVVAAAVVLGGSGGLPITIPFLTKKEEGSIRVKVN